MLIIIDENDTFTNCTDNESEDIEIILEYLHLSIPSSMILLSFTSLIMYTILEPSSTKKYMDKFLNPIHPVRCIST